MKLRTCNPSVRTSLLMLLSLLFVMSVTLPVFSVYSQPTGKTAEVVTQEPLIPQEDIPPAVGKELAAERGHMLRLRASEGNLNTVVFRNQDQTQTMYVFNHPVKYVNTVGEIKDISIEIADSTKEQGAFVTKDAYVQTFFPRDLYDGVTISADDVSIRSVPVAPASRNTAQAYRVDSETVAYPYGKNTSLEYTLTYTGYKEDIVVSSYTGQTEYQFRLYTGGLQLICEDGSYYLADADGKLRATIGDIIVFTADERNNCMGSMTHVTVKPNEEYLLTIHLDADYLKDEKTAYPIRIDPTVEILYEQNGEGAIEDVTINSLEGSSGSSGSLFIGKRDTYGISRVLMKFPGLSDDLVAFPGQLLKAEVELRDILGGSTAMTVTCHIFTGGTWDEDTASWTSVNPNSYSPAISSNSVSYSNGTSISHRYTFSIMDALIEWTNGVADPEQGLIFKTTPTQEASSTLLHKTFASYNRSSYQPSLYIVYTNPFYSSFAETSSLYSREDSSVSVYDNLQMFSNCYGYALRMFCSSDEGTPYKQQPGEFFDKTNGVYLDSCSTTVYNYSDTKACRNSAYTSSLSTAKAIFYELIEKDMAQMGYSIEEADASALSEPTTASKRLVLLVMDRTLSAIEEEIWEESGHNPYYDYRYDYHFYMQHTDGTWSHKPGNGEAISYCINDPTVTLTNENILTHAADGNGDCFANDPYVCNRYNEIVMLFYVTKPAVADYNHKAGQNEEDAFSEICTVDLAGDNFVTAQKIRPDITVQGKADHQNDSDYFVMTTTQSGNYQIVFNKAETTDSATFTWTVSVITEAGHLINNVQGTGTTMSFSATLGTGEYYIFVKCLTEHSMRQDLEYSIECRTPE